MWPLLPQIPVKFRGKAGKAGRHGGTRGLIKHSSQASVCKRRRKPPEKVLKAVSRTMMCWSVGKRTQRKTRDEPRREASRAWSLKSVRWECLTKGAFNSLRAGSQRRLSAKELMLSNRGAEDSRVPWTARRSNQSLLKETNPEYSLEGLMLKLKLQYFGHLIQTDDSLEKSLMLGKIEGRRRRG